MTSKLLLSCSAAACTAGGSVARSAVRSVALCMSHCVCLSECVANCRPLVPSALSCMLSGLICVQEVPGCATGVACEFAAVLSGAFPCVQCCSCLSTAQDSGVELFTPVQVL
jgi:hypothetical protein